MNGATYRQLLTEGETYLKEAGIEEAANDAWLLLSHAACLDRTGFFLRGTNEASLQEITAYRELLKKRHARIPLQHILGEQGFMGFSFRCDSRALIPRADTEILVQDALTILKEMRNLPQKTDERPDCVRVLDLCCGSGCIGISLSLLFQQAEVVCSDLSKEALALAGENAAHLGARVKLVQSDLFEQIDGSFGMIVSNPPYIPRGGIDLLQEEVALYDPRMALDGGEDGLDFYRLIAQESPRRLLRGGWLVMEIGHDQAAAVRALLLQAGFEQIRVRQDLSGLDRVVAGRLPETSNTDGE